MKSSQNQPKKSKQQLTDSGPTEIFKNCSGSMSSTQDSSMKSSKTKKKDSNGYTDCK